MKPVDVVPYVAAQVVGLLVNLVLINMWEEPPGRGWSKPVSGASPGWVGPRS